jgi:hypothetical protein
MTRPIENGPMDSEQPAPYGTGARPAEAAGASPPGHSPRKVRVPYLRRLKERGE